ncbi:MAG: methylenetetrahydrofolate reductase C-terminal domain-containing protein [Candidatus Hydrothermarchaeales archaeon]
MIVTSEKPFSEILEMVRGKKVGIIGCVGGCASLYNTGGKEQVESLSARLKEAGIEVVCSTTQGRHCTLTAFSDIKDSESLKESGVILIMACGVGVQSVAGLAEVPVYPALNTWFAGRKYDAVLMERCLACGDCVLHLTGGICPITRCPKSLLNGPCGGVYAGKCEVDRTNDCAWILIYKRLKELGQLDKNRSIKPPKDFKVMAHPRKFEVS